MSRIGINLGSGKDWNLVGWRGIDKVDGNFLDAQTVLPSPNNSLDAVYSSHFFEHIDDEIAQHLFVESYRVLRPGGMFRIVVPDFGIFLQKYRNNDEQWFRSLNNGRPEWGKYGVGNSISNLLLHWVANYDFNGPKGFYRGPPIGVDEQEVRDKSAQGIQIFCEWAQGLVPVDDSHVTTQHINWWDFRKFVRMLTQTGFKIVHEKQYMKSDSKIMLKNGMFDSWRPNREPFSLYVETTK